jgi:hypothetical protein
VLEGDEPDESADEQSDEVQVIYRMRFSGADGPVFLWMLSLPNKPIICSPD